MRRKIVWGNYYYYYAIIIMQSEMENLELNVSRSKLEESPAGSHSREVLWPWP